MKGYGRERNNPVYVADPLKFLRSQEGMYTKYVGPREIAEPSANMAESLAKAVQLAKDYQSKRCSHTATVVRRVSHLNDNRRALSFKVQQYEHDLRPIAQNNTDRKQNALFDKNSLDGLIEV